MTEKQSAPATIDEYISGFPPAVQKLLQRMRKCIRKAAPRAPESIKYRIPTFELSRRRRNRRRRAAPPGRHASEAHIDGLGHAPEVRAPLGDVPACVHAAGSVGFGRPVRPRARLALARGRRTPRRRREGTHARVPVAAARRARLHERRGCLRTGATHAPPDDSFFYNRRQSLRHHPTQEC